MDNVILQIGSYIGDTKNDPVFNLRGHPKILVEPIPRFFKQLTKNYENQDSTVVIKGESLKDEARITTINKAVSNYIGEIELTVPSEKNDFSKLPDWVAQLSSANKKHAINHRDIITETIIVPTTTIDQIIDTNNVNSIELLQIDTEGHEYYILMSYSFRIKPKKIIFEYKHIDGCHYVNKRFVLLINRLLKIGYKYKSVDKEDIILEYKKPTTDIDDEYKKIIDLLQKAQ